MLASTSSSRLVKPTPACLAPHCALPAGKCFAVAQRRDQASQKPITQQSSQLARRAGSTVAAAAAETAAPAAAAPASGKTLREVTKDDYYSVIEAAGDKLVVVDCYTEWCGPCKMILPTLQQWAEELEDKMEIVKFNCNKNNKELGVALGIKVAPTFLLYKGGNLVEKMTGAKSEQLRELIEKHI